MRIPHPMEQSSRGGSHRKPWDDKGRERAPTKINPEVTRARNEQVSALVMQQDCATLSRKQLRTRWAATRGVAREKELPLDKPDFRHKSYGV